MTISSDKSLDPSSPVPLYHQLENILRQEIETEEYEVGDKIPSERKLSAEYDLSRMTVKKAIDALVEAGLLVRKRGRGTYVAEPQLISPKFKGFNEALENGNLQLTGREVATEMLEQRVITNPAEEIKAKLNSPATEKIILTVRKRYLDRKPLGVEKSYVPKQVCPDLLETDLTEESIYVHLEKAGYKLTKAVDTVEAVLASEEIKKRLSLKDKTAIYKRVRVTYAGDKPVECSYNYYQGHKIKETFVQGEEERSV